MSTASKVPANGRRSSAYPSGTRNRILEKLRENGDGWQSTRSLSDVLGAPKSTVGRVLRTLASEGLVEWMEGPHHLYPSRDKIWRADLLDRP